MQKITPFLWFDNQAEEAAAFYCSVFKNSRIVRVEKYENASPDGSDVTQVVFELDGQPYYALDGGPEFKFNEAVSLYVDCADQEEVDELWAALTAGGGEPGPCGWLKDKYGLSWQIVPRFLTDLGTDPNKEAAGRALQAMLKMSKIDVQALRDAYNG
ncbi:MAG: VOC family protein [Thermoactinospora sp.]|nr:VOC family protein [Thermoactinospora sp.]